MKYFTPSVPFYKTTLQKSFVPKYKTIVKFLDAFITLFPNTPLININQYTLKYES